MRTWICWFVSDSGSEQPQGRGEERASWTPHQAPLRSWAPGTPGLPTSQEKRLFLSSHLWRDADAVSFSGLAFSRLTPESYDPAPANLCDGEQSCHGLTQDDPQVHGFLLTPHSPTSLSLLSSLGDAERGLEVPHGQAEREGEAVS